MSKIVHRSLTPSGDSIPDPSLPQVVIPASIVPNSYVNSSESCESPLCRSLDMEVEASASLKI